MFKHTYKVASVPASVNWGRKGDGEMIMLDASLIVKAYNEIITWRKNSFLVPYGKTGRDFIDQITKHINDWNNGTEMQHTALKAAFVLLAVGLQKPSKKSKAKDHQECLTRRLVLWKEGEVDTLLREGRMIQRHLDRSPKADPPNKAKIFAKLVMEGQIHSALRYLSEEDCGGVLPLSEQVMKQLTDKHPQAQQAKSGSVLFGPVEDVPAILYQQINGEMVREAALRTKGSCGPSGVDANGFKRILACKSFKKSSTNLCDSLATLARRLCTEFVDPLTIEPILASRLIPLDKGNGDVRPIGVGEVIRRIIGKCVTKVTKQDIILCPTIATYAINTYREPARLIIIGGKEMRSEEGTTQGDPLAMCLYAVSLQPLIARLNASTLVKQCWFADDATGAGSLGELKK